MIDKKVMRKALTRAHQRASDRLNAKIEARNTYQIGLELIECASTGYAPDESQDAAIKELIKIEREKLNAKKSNKH